MKQHKSGQQIQTWACSLYEADADANVDISGYGCLKLISAVLPIVVLAEDILLYCKRLELVTREEDLENIFLHQVCNEMQVLLTSNDNTLASCCRNSNVLTRKMPINDVESHIDAFTSCYTDQRTIRLPANTNTPVIAYRKS
uniref:Uncharacterized protein n=1 Tax=Glossina pallidipes TaxID=7398 RepID=A0A1B0AGS6_GLOPL